MNHQPHKIIAILKFIISFGDKAKNYKFCISIKNSSFLDHAFPLIDEIMKHDEK